MTERGMPSALRSGSWLLGDPPLSFDHDRPHSNQSQGEVGNEPFVKTGSLFHPEPDDS